MLPSLRTVGVAVNLWVVLSLLLGPALAAPAQAAPLPAAGVVQTVKPAVEARVKAASPGFQGEPGDEAGDTAGVQSGQPVTQTYAAIDVAGPAIVSAGTEQTLTVHIASLGPAALRQAQLEIEPERERADMNRLVYPLADLAVGTETELSAVVRIPALPGAHLRLRLRVTGGNLAEEATASYAVLVRQDQAEEWRADVGAQRWRPANSHLEIEQTEDGARPQRLTHRAADDQIEPGSPRLVQFELGAFDDRDQELADLAQPLTLRWFYQEAAADGLPVVAPSTLHFVRQNPDTAAWETLATVADEATGAIQTQTTVMGVYAVSSDPPQYAAPRDPFSGLEADLFTGAVTYNYPLPLFARPGGFGPGLALSYNSRRRDVHQDFGSSGSLLGWGWELEGIPSITGEGKPRRPLLHHARGRRHLQGSGLGAQRLVCARSAVAVQVQPHRGQRRGANRGRVLGRVVGGRHALPVQGLPGHDGL